MSAAPLSDPDSDLPDMPAARPRSLAEVRARIAAHPVEGGPDLMRAAFARLTGPHPALGRTPVGGVLTAVIGDGARRILWFHGGGYVFGSPESHGFAAERLAGAAEATVLLPDYPLAPQAAWPAQIEAARAVLDDMPGPVGLMGDSAGGHLALCLALERPRQVSALALISPNTDRSGASATRDVETDAMNDGATDAALARIAFGTRDGDDPELSPWRADLSILPPTLVLASSSEVLLDDALIFVRAAARAGAPISARIWPGLFHMWPLWPDALPAAGEALDAVAAHLSQAIEGG